MKTAIFPGTFDPFTIGHDSIVRRGLSFLDEIVIAIGVNDSKRTFFSSQCRVRMIQELFKNEPRIKVEAYDSLTISFAQQKGASLILRGIRTVNDFEYEKTIADMNRKISGIETILLFTEPEYACISSSAVRDLLKYNKDVAPFLPKGIILSTDK